MERLQRLAGAAVGVADGGADMVEVLAKRLDEAGIRPLGAGKRSDGVPRRVARGGHRFGAALAKVAAQPVEIGLDLLERRAMRHHPVEFGGEARDLRFEAAELPRIDPRLGSRLDAGGKAADVGLEARRVRRATGKLRAEPGHVGLHLVEGGNVRRPSGKVVQAVGELPDLGIEAGGLRCAMGHVGAQVRELGLHLLEGCELGRPFREARQALVQRADLGPEVIDLGRAVAGQVVADAEDLGMQRLDSADVGRAPAQQVDAIGKIVDLALDEVGARHGARGDIGPHGRDLLGDPGDGGVLTRARGDRVEPRDQRFQPVVQTVDDVGGGGAIHDAVYADGELVEARFEAIQMLLADRAAGGLLRIERRTDLVQAAGDVVDGGGRHAEVALTAGVAEAVEGLADFLQARRHVLDGGIARQAVARRAQFLDGGAQVGKAGADARRRRVHHRLAAVQRRLYRAAELADAHFQPAHGLWGIGRFHRPAERRDLFPEGVETSAIGHAPAELIEALGERRFARAPLADRADRLDLVADARQDAAVDRPLGGKRLDPAGEVEIGFLVLGGIAAERRHAGDQARHVRAERGDRIRDHLLVAAHGAGIGALVESALAHGDLGDRLGELVAYQRVHGRRRRRDDRLGLRLGFDQPAADAGELLVDAAHAIDFARHRGNGGRGVEAAACLFEAILEVAERPFQALAVNGSRRTGGMRDIGAAGKQHVEALAKVVQRGIGWRRGAAARLGHVDARLGGITIGLARSRPRRRPARGRPARLAFDLAAGRFVGIVEVAVEAIDQVGHAL